VKDVDFKEFSNDFEVSGTRLNSPPLLGIYLNAFTL